MQSVESVQEIKVFIASPSDVAAERAALCEAIGRLNSVFRDYGVRLQSVRWEADGVPKIGERAQQQFTEMVPKCDVFVGIMWTRFGEPTGRAESGTQEEFEEALASYEKTGKPEIMFYFCTRPYRMRTVGETKQLINVLEFRESLQEKGLVGVYERVEDFGTLVKDHLLRKALDLVQERTREELRREFAPSYDAVADSPAAVYRRMMDLTAEAKGVCLAAAQGHRTASERMRNIADSLRSAINEVRIRSNEVKQQVGVVELNRRTHDAQRQLHRLNELLEPPPGLWQGHAMNDATILALHNRGYTPEQIARKTGNGVNYVRQVIGLGGGGG